MIDVREIKERIDYEAYFAQDLELKGSGAERSAHCPFHDDRQASMSVNVETGLWKCHACGAEGDVFKFHQRLHGVDFQRALEEVGRFAGVDTLAPQKRRSRARKSAKDDGPQPIPEEEVQRYHEALLGREKALRFLAERKGLNLDTIRRYKLGYDGERIIIPIRDEAGAVRNLRRYHSEQKPKMLPYREGYGTVRLFPIDALASEELIIFEGEWDCMLARQLGLPGITQTGGAETWKDEWGPLFRGKRIWICYDNDDAGRDGAKKVANALAPLAAEVRVITLPVEGKGEDFSDWVIHYGGTAEAFRALMAEAELVEPPLPAINADNGNLPELAEQAWEAVRRKNNPPFLFRRGGLITRLEFGDDGAPHLAVVSRAGLRGILARAARWYRIVGRGDNAQVIDALPPLHVVDDMMAAPEIPLPVITRVVEAPVFGRDGELRLEPGYHAHSRSYYWESNLRIPEVRQGRAREDLPRALELILTELMGDFPFVGPSERAHALAALLLPFARELITGATPLHLIEAPTPGTGKSLLADAITIPATGRPAETMTEGRDEDEWRKRITSAMIKAPTFLLLDNLRRKLDSAALAAALTATTWQDRILGRSELTSLPIRTIWLATGNNPALSTEMARRTVRIRIDARVAKPWQRTGFRHPDLRTWAIQHRGELVWAALTIIQAWVDAGMPPGAQTLGQYESWARVMGGILDVAEVPGFLANVDELYEAADEETADWEAFCEAWWTSYGSSPQSTRELFRIAEDRDLLLTVRGGKNEQSQKIRFGNALKQMRDRQIGRWRIEHVGSDRTRSMVYRLVEVETSGGTVDDDDPY